MITGRGTGDNPPNRFDRVHAVPLTERDPHEEEPAARAVPTQFHLDQSRSILSKNDSPDLGFTYSINPYRGCEHGCIYCYARPTHEYLGFSAGLDFETRIMVKPDAPDLLTAAFLSAAWTPQPVLMSGNTDCYQPAERSYGITRGCLRVFARFRNPVSIITKNALILRDLDLLQDLASDRLVSVTISLTTLDQDLQKTLEPRTAAPVKRLEVITALAGAGVPVGVNVAPVVPGLNDREIPALLRSAAEAGATRAGRVMLRLPHAVKGLFADWLQRNYPHKAEHVLALQKDVRDGGMSCSEFGKRLTGTGSYAEAISRLFDMHCRRLGLNAAPLTLNVEVFTRTPDQLGLF